MTSPPPKDVGPGLPVTQATEQAARAGGVFRLAADLITARAGTADAGAPGGPGYVLDSPAGIAGLITPWRTPFLAQARAVAPALAAGCTVVLKPDEWAPLPAALLAEITTAAGLPDGVLNIVHGSLHPRAPGAQARDALIAHPGVARLWFEGEAATGRQIMLDAATHGKALSTGLAGNSPCLIFADADLDQATDSALFGAFALNGQRRTATSTILAERPVYDTLVSRLAQRADRIRVGDPSDPATQLGPLPHAEHYDRLTSWVRLGIREGAWLAAGGRGGRPAGGELPRRDRARRRGTVDADLRRTGLRAGGARHAVRHRRRGDLARQRRHRPDGGLHLDLRPAASAPSGAGHRVGEHLGELPQLTGPGTRGRKPRARPTRRRCRGRPHRLLHALPDRAHRGRRQAGAAVRRLSGAAQPADRSWRSGRAAG